MMNKIRFAITTLAILSVLTPAFAMANKPIVANETHPITGLIGDWHAFQSNVLNRTQQFNHYSDMSQKQWAALPATLVGHWQTQSSNSQPGNQLQTDLNLGPDRTFTYKLVETMGTTRHQWQFSGEWEVKNDILLLLINRSNYPGEQKQDVLAWRLLHVGNHSLLFARSAAGQMVAMSRASVPAAL